MKYTIELTNKQKAQMDCIIDIVHRYVGFNPKLEPIKATNVEDTNEYQIGYKVGLEDGNKIADKDLKEIQDSTYDVAYNKGIEDLTHAMEVYYPLNSKERLDYFGMNIMVDTYARRNPKDLIAKAKSYEEKKKAEEESIKVGDVVKFNEKCHDYDRVKSREFLVLHMFDNGLVTILYDNGDTGAAEISLLDKTGRHIDEIEQLLDKLRGEEE